MTIRNLASLGLSKVDGRGGIQCPELYARAKMLDHSGWVRYMPRNITPSDIDMALDNMGRILLVEFSPTICKWNHLASGQRRLYESLVIVGRGSTIAVLAHHNTPPDRYIDTLLDVDYWDVLGFSNGNLEEMSYSSPSASWLKFILWWFDSGWFQSLNQK